MGKPQENCGFMVILWDLPSGNKHGWNLPTVYGGFDSSENPWDFDGQFSSQPCLITGGYVEYMNTSNKKKGSK